VVAARRTRTIITAERDSKAAHLRAQGRTYRAGAACWSVLGTAPLCAQMWARRAHTRTVRTGLVRHVRPATPQVSGHGRPHPVDSDTPPVALLIRGFRVRSPGGPP